MVKKTKNKIKKFVKNNNQKKQIIEVLLFSFVIIYVIYFCAKLIIIPTSKTNIVYGKISDEKSVDAFVLRDEKVLDTNMVTDINLIKTEGSRVSKNEKIGMYKNQNKEQWEEKIKQLDVKIENAMKEQSNVYSNDIQNIENQIEEQIQKINKTNQIQIIQQYENEITKLLSKKAKITGELSPSGSYIKELIAERAEYEAKLNESSNYIKTTLSGVVSTRIDGLEEKLGVERINNTDNLITYKELLDYNIRTDELIPNNRKKVKIIDNYACYLIVNIIDLDKEIVKVNNKVKVRLNNGNTTIATIHKIIDEENSTTIFLEISQNVEYLINYRKVSLDIIWWEYEGWKIPNKCIEYDTIQYNSLDEEGNSVLITEPVPYVKLLKYNKEYKIYVDIKKQNDDYSVIDNISEENLKKYSLQEQNKRNLSLYDELIIK